MNLLSWVEKQGNRLPDPSTLFAALCVGVVLLSALMSWLGAKAVHPSTGEDVIVQNLLSASYLQRMLVDAVKNFAQFPPLGVVLVAVIGIGVAERSGFLAAILRGFVMAVPSWALGGALVFAGVMSSFAADTGYVVLIPLGAALFAAAGRNPLVGLAATFAGVAGGFSANLLITSLDPLLAGITTEAAKLVEADRVVLASANYYFMVVSTFLLTVVGAVVTRFVSRKQGAQNQPVSVTVKVSGDSGISKLSSQERKAMRWSLVVLAALVIVISFLVIPQDGLLRDEKGTLAPFYSSLIVLISLVFLVASLVYGAAVGQIKSDKDAMGMASESMAQMGSYIVLVFFAAQFLAYFSWSQLGLYTAIVGANGLKATGFTEVPLLGTFVILAAVVNLFMGSASAKWALMAPIFVPMLMLVGTPPEVTQTAYRIGDSATNMISPLLPYLPLILVYARRYDSKAGIGTIVSLMLPYSISFLVVWLTLFLVWISAGIPLGF